MSHSSLHALHGRCLCSHSQGTDSIRVFHGQACALARNPMEATTIMRWLSYDDRVNESTSNATSCSSSTRSSFGTVPHCDISTPVSYDGVECDGESSDELHNQESASIVLPCFDKGQVPMHKHVEPFDINAQQSMQQCVQKSVQTTSVHADSGEISVIVPALSQASAFVGDGLSEHASAFVGDGLPKQVGSPKPLESPAAASKIGNHLRTDELRNQESASSVLPCFDEGQVPEQQHVELLDINVQPSMQQFTQHSVQKPSVLVDSGVSDVVQPCIEQTCLPQCVQQAVQQNVQNALPMQDVQQLVYLAPQGSLCPQGDSTPEWLKPRVRDGPDDSG